MDLLFVVTWPKGTQSVSTLSQGPHSTTWCGIGAFFLHRDIIFVNEYVILKRSLIGWKMDQYLSEGNLSESERYCVPGDRTDYNVTIQAVMHHNTVIAHSREKINETWVVLISLTLQGKPPSSTSVNIHTDYNDSNTEILISSTSYRNKQHKYHKSKKKTLIIKSRIQKQEKKTAISILQGNIREIDHQMTWTWLRRGHLKWVKSCVKRTQLNH